MNMTAITARFRRGGIGRQISWLMMQSLTEAGTMTIATFLAARMFGPVSWGQLGILLAGVQLVATIGDGFFPTIIKYVSEARAAGDPAAAARIGWRFMWVAVAVLAIVSTGLGVLAVMVFPGQVTVTWIALAAGLAISRGWRAAFDGIYRGLQWFQTPAVAGSVCVTLAAAGVVYLAARGFRVSGYLAVVGGWTVVNCLWLAVVFLRRNRGSAEPSWSGEAKVTNNQGEPQSADPGTPVQAAPPICGYSTEAFLRYSFPLALRGIWSFLFLKINIWMLGAMATDFDAGQFRLTDQFLTIPSLLLSSLLLAVAPRIAAAQLAGGQTLELLLSRVYGLVILLTVPLAVFFWFNRPVITLMFPDFAPASEMLRYFAPAMLVMGIGYAASIVPVQGGRPGLALWITVIGGIANVVAAYAGFKLGGVYGLAMGTATVHFLTFAMGTVVTHKAFGLRFRVRFS